MNAAEIKKLQEDGIFFTEKEIDVLIDGADEIGFEPVPYLVNDAIFNKADALKRGNILFSHRRSKNSLTVNRSTIKFLGLDIFKNTAADIFFSIIFKDIDDKHYADNYQP